MHHLSALTCAIFFGIISPKKKTTRVEIIVASKEPIEPKSAIHKIVARTDIAMCAMFVPIKVVIKVASNLSNMKSAILAL